MHILYYKENYFYCETFSFYILKYKVFYTINYHYAISLIPVRSSVVCVIFFAYV